MNYGDSLDFSKLIHDSWLNVINKEILVKTQELLNDQIKNAKDTNHNFYPYDMNDIFKIFRLCPLEKVSVVILGQDPYYADKNQGNGIAFSVNNGVKIPPSLRNIFKEAKIKRCDGDLSNWVQQGIFLINASLTVLEKVPNSHKNIWDMFVQHIIDIINEKANNSIIFVAWGEYAKKKYSSINLNKHILISSSHPSPLSCYKTENPFIGSNVFEKIKNIKGIYLF